MLNSDYRNEVGTIQDMAFCITLQHPVTCWLKDAPKKYDNFLCAQFLGADWDDETVTSDISTVMKIPMVANHAAIIYTTQSHTPERPRCRAIFVLPSPTYDPELQRLRTRAIAWALDADKQVTDPARAFFGTGDNGRVEVPGHIMSFEYLDMVIQEYQEANKPRYAGPVTASDEVLVASAVKIARSESGIRNRMAYWLGGKLAEKGVAMEVAEAAMMEYQMAVEADGNEPFTKLEALNCLRSAYQRKVHQNV